MSFYKKTIFWENIKRSLATFGGGTVLGLHEFGAADHWMILAGVMTFAGGLISIWMTDQDNDGYIDIFSK